jgi:hypothetical protein
MLAVMGSTMARMGFVVRRDLFEAGKIGHCFCGCCFCVIAGDNNDSGGQTQLGSSSACKAIEVGDDMADAAVTTARKRMKGSM